MTNDANDYRPRRVADSAPETGQPDPTPREAAPAVRRGWSNFGAAEGGAAEPQEDSPQDDPTANQGAVQRPFHETPLPLGEGGHVVDPESAPRGTPTPGHRAPSGRPDETPNPVAKPLAGTTPKATNDRPQAPTGSGSEPTAVRRADDSPRAVAPDFRPAGSGDSDPADGPDSAGSSHSDSNSSDSDSDRPANPFAPKNEPERRSRLPLGRGKHKHHEQDAAPVGKRVAEPEPRRLGFGRRRGADGAQETKQRTPLGGRNVVALTVAGVAIVAIVALVATTALWLFNRDAEVATPPGMGLEATPGPVLSSGQMVSEAMAKSVDPRRTWTQTLDQAGVNDASPAIPCVGPLTADQPIPEITQLRGVTASGEDRTALLHRADAYASNEEAQKVFKFRGAELGSCTDTPLFIEKGLTVTGIGDEAAGVRLVLQDTKSEYHSVLLVRTGRVVNMLDVARAGAPVDMEAMVRALGQSINRQCGPAVGLCTAPTTSVTVGIPPSGGEQAGFLNSGDIPRVTPGSGSWRGNPPATRVDIQDGTGCEAVDFGSVGGTGVERHQRTYLLRNDAAAPPQFGVDEVVLTMASNDEARELVDRVHNNIASCGTRTLTSQVASDSVLGTPGAGGVEIKGHQYVINAKIDQAQSQKYRVGIFSAGNKFVYLRSNPTATFDFSDDAWLGINLRAGERVTQRT